MSKNLSQQVVLDRRGFVAATFATVAGLGLAGCSDTSAEADKGSAAGSSKGSEDTEVSATLDAKAFDKSGSNGPAILEEFVPKASQQEFKTDEEARQALQQGRVDAYVIDNNMQQSALVREPGKYKIAGKPFGSKEPYGIGLPLDSDGVAFVNDFLKKIEDDGTWTELWQICIGDRTGDTNVPELPEIGA